jgi:PBS lyase HEAT-like repeat
MLWWTQRRLRSQDPEVRRRVAAILCERRDVRQAAAESLAALGWQPMDAIERSREAVARRAWQEAANLGRAAVEPLREALQDRRQDVRHGAAEALTRLGWQSADSLQRVWLAIALGKTSEAVAL